MTLSHASFHLIGNLTRDPELRALPSGTSVANFGVAVNEKFKNANGQDVEKVHFFDVKVFGKQAEIAAQYLSKGDALFAEGKLELEQWEDKDGGRRSKVVLNARRFTMLGGGGGKSGASGPASRQSAPARRPAPASAQHEPVTDDDIPF